MELYWVWPVAKAQAEMANPAGVPKAGKATILERKGFVKYRLQTENTSFRPFKRAFIQHFLRVTLRNALGWVLETHH